MSYNLYGVEGIGLITGIRSTPSLLTASWSPSSGVKTVVGRSVSAGRRRRWNRRTRHAARSRQSLYALAAVWTVCESRYRRGGDMRADRRVGEVALGCWSIRRRRQSGRRSVDSICHVDIVGARLQTQRKRTVSVDLFLSYS